MSTPYQKYIKNFSKLPRNKLQSIVDSKPKYPSPFLPRRNLYYKAAENSLKSRNMNRSRHNLPEFLIDKVFLDELKEGKLDLSYFQKILDNDNQDTVTREEAIRTLKTIRKMLSLDIPGLLNSRGLIFDVLLATAIGGDTVLILYKRRELIQKIDSILNSVPIQYETNPLMRNETPRLLNNLMKNETPSLLKELNTRKKEFEPLQLGGKRSTRKAKKSMRKTRKHR